jgi:hypothetical protein
MRSFLLIGIIIFSANLSAMTIDFEDVPVPGNQANTVSFTWDGLRFTGRDHGPTVGGLTVYKDGWSGATVRPTVGDISLMGWSNYSDPFIDMERDDGGLFRLESFIAGSGDVFSIAGIYEDYSSIYFLMNDLVSFDLGNNHTLYYLPEGFNDLIEVTWQGQESGVNGYIMLDNIAVTAVPIPAAVWLFGSALAGLGWLKRIKKS